MIHNTHCQSKQEPHTEPQLHDNMIIISFQTVGLICTSSVHYFNQVKSKQYLIVHINEHIFNEISTYQLIQSETGGPGAAANINLKQQTTSCTKYFVNLAPKTLDHTLLILQLQHVYIRRATCYKVNIVPEVLEV